VCGWHFGLLPFSLQKLPQLISPPPVFCIYERKPRKKKQLIPQSKPNNSLALKTGIILRNKLTPEFLKFGILNPSRIANRLEENGARLMSHVKWIHLNKSIFIELIDRLVSTFRSEIVLLHLEKGMIYRGGVRLLRSGGREGGGCYVMRRLLIGRNCGYQRMVQDVWKCEMFDCCIRMQVSLQHCLDFLFQLGALCYAYRINLRALIHNFDLIILIQWEFSSFQGEFVDIRMYLYALTTFWYVH